MKEREKPYGAAIRSRCRNSRWRNRRDSHSQGAIHTKNALKRYPKELTDRMSVIAVCPATYIENKLCGEAWNIDNQSIFRDAVGYFDPISRFRCRNNTISVPSKDEEGVSFHDHAFTSPTYRDTTRTALENITKIRVEQGATP